MSDSDAQTAIPLTKQMHKDLENKMSSAGEDRDKIDGKLAELTTSVALDSAMLHGLPELTDGKFVAQHKRFTRLEEQQDDSLFSSS